MKKTLLISALACGLGLFLGLSNATANTNVDLELVLAVDVSGSIDTSEYNLQKNAYAAAFNNSAIYNSIMAGGQYHSIAVTMVEWSGTGQQTQVVPWTIISSAASSQAFASAINGVSRAYSGSTGVFDAIYYSSGLFNNAFDGTRQIIDVSGDGQNNTGNYTLAQARSRANSFGVDQINGLAILNEEAATLMAWYDTNVKYGTDAFVTSVNDFGDFAVALEDKLAKEISGVPEPATMLLFGTGLAGLAAVGRRKRS